MSPSPLAPHPLSPPAEPPPPEPTVGLPPAWPPPTAPLAPSEPTTAPLADAPSWVQFDDSSYVAKKEPTTVVILSDRFEAMVVTMGSFLSCGNGAMDIWVIGDMTEDSPIGNTTLGPMMNEALKPGPEQSINFMSLDAATDMLLRDGMPPLWTWQEYGTLGGDQDEDEQPPVLIKPEPWDYDNMHHDPFNMLRFYLPYLEPFRKLETLFFADDDIIVQQDVSLLEGPMGQGVVIAATCNGWIWNDDCMYNELFFRGKSWYEFPVTYLGKDKNSDFKGCAETHEEGAHLTCQSDDYEAAVQNMSEVILGRPTNFAEEPRWNFGCARFNLTEWRLQNMTDIFNAFMAINYKHGIWPETSLSYGLGIAYFAFSGRVRCWNELTADGTFVDGLGYVSIADFKANALNATEVLEAAIVLHWSGRKKPFSKTSHMDPSIAAPFDKMWDRLAAEGMQIPDIDDLNANSKAKKVSKLNVPGVSKLGVPGAKRASLEAKQVEGKALLYTEPRSGSEWYMELLDETEDICATGAIGNPTNAFPRESLIPGHYPGVKSHIPQCAQKHSCLWGFVAEHVPQYVAMQDTWCTDPRNAWLAKVSVSNVTSNFTRHSVSAQAEAPDNEDYGESTIHQKHGEMLCTWAAHLRSEHPDVTDYTRGEGVQILWNNYEYAAFATVSDLLPCSTSCETKPARVFKFMSNWGLPQMNREIVEGPNGPKSVASDIPKFFLQDAPISERDDVRYFEGDYNFSLAQQDSPTNNEILPSVNWDKYKIIELRRWNVLERCLSLIMADLTGIFHGSSGDEDKEKVETPRIDVDQKEMMYCLNAAMDHRNGDLVRKIAYANRDSDWLSLSYEVCALPSQTQDCVDATVEHIVPKKEEEAPVKAMSRKPRGKAAFEGARVESQTSSMRKSLALWHHFSETATKTPNVPPKIARHDVSSMAIKSPKASTAHAKLEGLRADLEAMRSIRHEPQAVVKALRETGHDAPRSSGLGVGVAKSSVEEERVRQMANADSNHVAKSRSGRWDGIANSEVLSASLIYQGYATFLQPIYCFVWDEHGGGADIAAYLSLLPSDYIIPGSSFETHFDLAKFKEVYDDEQEKQHLHSLMAYGFGHRARLDWVEAISAVTTRPVILFRSVRDVLPHRLSMFASSTHAHHQVQMQSGKDFAKQMKEWVLSESYPRRAQLMPLHALNATYRELPIEAIWRLVNTSAVVTGADANNSVDTGSIYLGPTMSSDNPITSLCVLTAMTSLPIPWDKIVNNVSGAGRGPVKKAGPIASARGSLLDEEVATSIIALETDELFYVGRTLDNLEALQQKYGCGGQGPPSTATNLGTGPEDEQGADTGWSAEDTTPDPAPVLDESAIYYFVHVPKSGGTTFSHYLSQLSDEYVVPGSRESSSFDVDELMEKAHEKVNVTHPLIAFSHSGIKFFCQTIEKSALGDRRVRFIMLLRDTLSQRMSFFHEKVGPAAKGSKMFRRYNDISTWVSESHFATSRATQYANVAAGLYNGTCDAGLTECWMPSMLSYQIKTLYHVNPGWRKMNIQDVWQQLHAEESLASCVPAEIANVSDAGAWSNDEVLFQHCPGSTFNVSLGLVGLVSDMRSTLCLVNRKLGLPVHGESSQSTASATPAALKATSRRFKLLRPMDAEPSFGTKATASILASESREMIFSTLAGQMLKREADRYSCSPAVPQRTHQAANDQRDAGGAGKKTYGTMAARRRRGVMTFALQPTSVLSESARSG